MNQSTLPTTNEGEKIWEASIKKRNGFNPSNGTDKSLIQAAGNYKTTYIAGLYKSRKYNPWHQSDPPLSFPLR
jgi:hypothetical protein